MPGEQATTTSPTPDAEHITQDTSSATPNHSPMAVETTESTGRRRPRLTRNISVPPPETVSNDSLTEDDEFHDAVSHQRANTRRTVRFAILPADDFYSQQQEQQQSAGNEPEGPPIPPPQTPPQGRQQGAGRTRSPRGTRLGGRREAFPHPVEAGVRSSERLDARRQMVRQTDRLMRLVKQRVPVEALQQHRRRATREPEVLISAQSLQAMPNLPRERFEAIVRRRIASQGLRAYDIIRFLGRPALETRASVAQAYFDSLSADDRASVTFGHIMDLIDDSLSLMRALHSGVTLQDEFRRTQTRLNHGTVSTADHCIAFVGLELINLLETHGFPRPTLFQILARHLDGHSVSASIRFYMPNVGTLASAEDEW